jgi:hypothetical protein
MAVDARCARPADGPASGGLCAPKRSPPGVARCGHYARGKRTRNVLHPMGPARNPVGASKHRVRSELRSPRKLLRNLREFHTARDTDEHLGLRVAPASRTRFITEMRFAAALLILTFLAVSAPGKSAREEPKVIEKVTPLPVALDPNFEFRKTKLFFMSEKGPKPSERARQETSKIGGKSNSPNQKTATLQDAPIVFERQYRLFGAVSGLDSRQRFGNYFDFFWRVKHPSDVTVRLEYRQEKLHEHVQAQEITYRNARGTNKTEFKVIGDDYFDDGRVIAWRCLLIANGRIVAENRSFLWE